MKYQGTIKEKSDRIAQAIEFADNFPQYSIKEVCKRFYVTYQSFKRHKQKMKEEQSNDLEPKEDQDNIQKVENDQLNKPKTNKIPSPKEALKKELNEAGFKFKCEDCGHY